MYVSNIMTEQGQTDNYTLSDHVKALHAHIGTGIFDIVLADTGEVIPEYIRKYNKEGSEVVEPNVSRTSAMGVRVIERNMSCIRYNRVRHDPNIIASTIIELICNDLKFHDKQNETEYLLLNSVLKEQKKIQAKQAKNFSAPVPEKTSALGGGSNNLGNDTNQAEKDNANKSSLLGKQKESQNLEIDPKQTKLQGLDQKVAEKAKEAQSKKK